MLIGLLLLDEMSQSKKTVHEPGLRVASRAITRSGDPVIPPEISDCIIDFLHSDKDSLRRCSLVCRAWLPSSSLHLFERFWWPPCHHAWHGWFTKRCHCAFLDHSNFWPELLSFIEGSQRVRDYVRTLRICFCWTVVDFAGWGDGRAEYHHKIALSNMGVVIDKLPHLRWLYLSSPGFLPEPSPIARMTRGTRSLDRLTLDYPAPPLASDERLGLFADLLRLFKRISVLQLTDVMRHRADYHPTPIQDASDLPEIHTFQVDTATSLALVQFLRILTATADPASISSIAVHDLIGSGPSPEMIPLLQAVPNLQTLTLDGVHSARILDRSMSDLFPRLRKLTVSGYTMVGWGSGAFSTWPSLRNVADCRIPSVDELLLQFTLKARMTDPPMPVLDGDLRYALRALDWTLLDAVLGAYGNVSLELRLHRVSLALSNAQFPHAVRLVEGVARDRMSARARQGVRLRICWYVPHACVPSSPSVSRAPKTPDKKRTRAT